MCAGLVTNTPVSLVVANAEPVTDRPSVIDAVKSGVKVVNQNAKVAVDGQSFNTLSIISWGRRIVKKLGIIGYPVTLLLSPVLLPASFVYDGYRGVSLLFRKITGATVERLLPMTEEQVVNTEKLRQERQALETKNAELSDQVKAWSAYVDQLKVANNQSAQQTQLLAQQLSQAQCWNQSLGQQVAEQQQRADYFERMRAENLQQADQLQNNNVENVEIETINRKCKEFEEKKNQLLRNLEASQAEINPLIHELKNTCKELQDVDVVNTNRRKELEQEITNLRGQLQNGKNQIDRLIAEKCQLIDQGRLDLLLLLRDAEQNRNELELQIADQRNKLRDCTIEINKLKESVETYQQEKEQLESRLVDAELQITQGAESRREFVAESHCLHEKLSDQQNAFEKDIEGLRAEIRQKETIIRQKEEEMQQKDAEFCMLEQRLGDVNDRFKLVEESLNKFVEKHQENYEDLRSRNSQLSRSVEVKELQVKNAWEQNERLERQVKDLSATNTDVRAQLESASVDAIKISVRAEQYKNALRDVIRSACGNFTTELDDESDGASDCTPESMEIKLNRWVTLAQSEIKNGHKRIADLEEDVKSLEKKLEEQLTEQSRNLAQMRVDADKTVNDSQEQIKQLRIELDEKTVELQAAREQVDNAFHKMEALLAKIEPSYGRGSLPNEGSLECGASPNGDTLELDASQQHKRNTDASIDACFEALCTKVFGLHEQLDRTNVRLGELARENTELQKSHHRQGQAVQKNSCSQTDETFISQSALQTGLNPEKIEASALRSDNGLSEFSESQLQSSQDEWAAVENCIISVGDRIQRVTSELDGVVVLQKGEAEAVLADKDKIIQNLEQQLCELNGLSQELAGVKQRLDEECKRNERLSKLNDDLSKKNKQFAIGSNARGEVLRRQFAIGNTGDKKILRRKQQSEKIGMMGVLDKENRSSRRCNQAVEGSTYERIKSVEMERDCLKLKITKLEDNLFQTKDAYKRVLEKVDASQRAELQMEEIMMGFSSLLLELDGDDDSSSGQNFAERLKNQVRARLDRDQKEINELRAQLTEKRLADDGATGQAVNVEK